MTTKLALEFDTSRDNATKNQSLDNNAFTDMLGMQLMQVNPYIYLLQRKFDAGIAQNDGNGGSGRDEKSRLVGVIKRARVAKGCLEAVIVAACAFWVGWWLVSPDPEDRHKYVDIWIGDKISNSRFFNTDGHEGVYFLCF